MVLENLDENALEKRGTKRERSNYTLWKEAELELLYTLLVPQYAKLNEKLLGASKIGRTPRQQLLFDLSKHLTDAGFEKGSNQIEDKITNDLRKIRKKISVEKQNLVGTGGGSGSTVPKIPDYLLPLEAILRKEYSVCGISGATEVSDDVYIGDANLEKTLLESSMDFFGDVETTSEIVNQIPFKKPLRASTPTRTPSRFKSPAAAQLSSCSTRNHILEHQLIIEPLKKELLEQQLMNEKLHTRNLEMEYTLMQASLEAKHAKTMYYSSRMSSPNTIDYQTETFTSL